MTLIYNDNGTVHRIKYILTNHSMTVDEALGDFDMDAWADKMGWDGWDFDCLETDYRTDYEIADKVAAELNASGEWNPELLKELCKLADMEDEWEKADGENFESVAYTAAKKLGVEI